MSEGHVAVAGRELVLASAGSGKTFRLSSRLIGLLAAGAPPEEILASTFTRKAAGEILERVLLRLARGALSDEEARALSASLPEDAAPDGLSRDRCAVLLAEAVRSLHRLQVHTLDAFFHRMVRAFALELGLPGEWEVADEPAEARLRSRALEEALGAGDTGVLVELVRMAGRGDADRSVHRLLLDQVTALHGAYHEIAPGAEDPWGRGTGAKDDTRPSPERIEEAVEWLERMELPTTKAGAPRRAWVRNIEGIVEAARSRDWDALLGCTLVQRVIDDDLRFDHADVGPEICEPIGVLLEAAVADMRPMLQNRVRALGRFLPDYDARLRRLQREEGMFGFRDLTHALLNGAATENLAELYYRMDGRIRHVLLDEFQDTSTAQWAALEPLVGEILSGYEGERAAFIVADAKQSIYGWRDGEPRILDRIQNVYGLEPSTLTKSWRSSRVVLALVNRVFGDVASNPVVDDDRIRGTVVRWAASFHEHHAARDLPGFVSVETGPAPDDEPHACVSGSPLLRHTALRVAELHRSAPDASIGLLTRKNATVAGLIAELRALGIEASEEGGVPVIDSAAVVAVLALLRVVDHPADVVSRYLVAHSPLGPLVGLQDWRSESLAEGVARRLRDRLLMEGYGRVLGGWTGSLDPHLTGRDRRRLRATVELAHRWDERATLRTTDFVHAAEATRVEDAGGGGGVRIMTVHRSKGLEFDVVVLPELDGISLTPGKLPPFLTERDDDGAGPVRRILPGVAASHAKLFPELEAAVRQHREAVVRDALSTLYVALTRARSAVLVFMSPDGKRPSSARSGARLVREALAPDQPAEPRKVLWTHGDPEWWQGAEGAPPRRPESRVLSGRGPLIFAEAPRRRLLERRSPSDLEGGDRVPLRTVLRPHPPASLERGALVHAWMEALEWLEPELPDRERCLEIARERTPGFDDPEGLLDEWLRWLEAPAVHSLLTREHFPVGTAVERELAFLSRYRDGILRGVADRVMKIPDPEGARLLVIDWKTDRLRPDAEGELDRRTGFYRPQMEAYCGALARIERIEPARVEGAVVFLTAGVVRPIRDRS